MDDEYDAEDLLDDAIDAEEDGDIEDALRLLDAPSSAMPSWRRLGCDARRFCCASSFRSRRWSPRMPRCSGILTTHGPCLPR